MEISAGEARRMAVYAQGLGRARPGKVDGRALRTTVASLGAVQIDAVNVLVRSHYLPVFSRLGAYPLDAFDRAAYERKHTFEYAGHAASFLPIELHPLMRWRMAGAAVNKHAVEGRERVERDRPGYTAAVLAEITERGPLAFTDLADAGRREKTKTKTKYAESSLLWWSWSDGKWVLERLASEGVLAVAGRKRGFEATYDLAQRVIPPAVLNAPTPTPEDAQRDLVLRAVKAMGVATTREVADYFRLFVATAKARLRELVDAGVLQEARVEGWKDIAYVDPDAKAPAAEGHALLSLFDSLIWERSRTQRIFGFRHVFELYVPPPKRLYGYYVLPFLLGDALVGRVDLKAERASSTLQVKGAFLEPHAPAPRIVADALATELRDLATWLGLTNIDVAARGDLAPTLEKAVRKRRA
jgi:uncharacterized protein YcaQ